VADEPATRPAADSEAHALSALPTALVYDPTFLDHRVPEDFPEQPERLIRAMEVIEQALAARPDVAERVVRLAPRPATLEELCTVHDAAYVEHVQRAVERAMEGDGYEGAPRRLASEVYVSPGSYTAARLAAGAPLVALDAIGEHKVRNGYALVRPPGHHARPDKAMGFCLFNNVAVAARSALDDHGLERVMILDWDVHHGNGTNDIFHADPRVLFVSIHQSPLYPGTGPASDIGSGAGEGYTVNLPVSPGAGDATYGSLVIHVAVPLARAYEPELILISAGFDAHAEDPLADGTVTEAGYATMTAAVRDVAAELGIPVGGVLEGGYALRALGRSVAVTLAGLAAPPGSGASHGRELGLAPESRAARERLAAHWPNLT
jgi:acetoin utilization deacetylase AcuC-like enzyme